MAEEEKKGSVEQRRLKIRGSGSEEMRGEKKEGKEKEKEKGSKLWVVVILAVSIIVSLVFSMKGGKHLQQPMSREVPERVESPKQGGGGLFGPAVYEFGK